MILTGQLHKMQRPLLHHPACAFVPRFFCAQCGLLWLHGSYQLIPLILFSQVPFVQGENSGLICNYKQGICTSNSKQILQNFFESIFFSNLWYRSFSRTFLEELILMVKCLKFLNHLVLMTHWNTGSQKSAILSITAVNTSITVKFFSSLKVE